MSVFQTYIDQHLIPSGYISQAAIISLQGEVLASTPDFDLSPTETKTLTSSFEDASVIRSSGLIIHNNKYFVLKNDSNAIYCRKGTTGLVCVKTQKYIIVAGYGEGTQPGSAILVVESLAHFMKQTGN